MNHEASNFDGLTKALETPEELPGLVEVCKHARRSLNWLGRKHSNATLTAGVCSVRLNTDPESVDGIDTVEVISHGGHLNTELLPSQFLEQTESLGD